MNIYHYVRVSTDRQSDEGQSLGAQQRILDGYTQMHGLPPATCVFVERAVSGSVPLRERPEGSKLLAVLKPDDAVLATRLDRMFRSAADALTNLESFRRRRIALHLIDLGGNVSSDGIAKLVFSILAAVAEAESERIRSRVREIKADQRQRMRFLGGKVPFGWQVAKDGALVEIPKEQGAIKAMVRLSKNGRSIREIAAVIQKKGFALSVASVHNIITRHNGRRKVS